MANLIAAYTVAWAILILYVTTLAVRQRRLNQSLQRLEAATGPAAPPPIAGKPHVQ